MAACGAMNRTRRLAAVAAIAVAVVSCTRVVDGAPKLAIPKVGAPIAWDRCVAASSGAKSILANAQCGKLGVPVDYSKPDAGTASVGVIKFPATGAKIGSLVINPGGPGESGINAAVAMFQHLPPQLKDSFGVGGFDPRGVGLSKPEVWCNSDADNDKQRADPQVDYSPAGVAHIVQTTRDFVP